jgi:hypothetical protein
MVAKGITGLLRVNNVSNPHILRDENVLQGYSSSIRDSEFTVKNSGSSLRMPASSKSSQVMQYLQDVSDPTTSYLHIVITSEQDNCSVVTQNKIMDMNATMKEVSQHFKCAAISFNARDNTDLNKQLQAILLSCASKESDIMRVFATSSNFKQSISSVVYWFNEKTPAPSMMTSMASIGDQSMLNDIDGQQLLEVKELEKRCIMVSVCLSSRVM